MVDMVFALYWLATIPADKPPALVCLCGANSKQIASVVSAICCTLARPATLVINSHSIGVSGLPKACPLSCGFAVYCSVLPLVLPRGLKMLLVVPLVIFTPSVRVILPVLTPSLSHFIRIFFSP